MSDVADVEISTLRELFSVICNENNQCIFIEIKFFEMFQYKVDIFVGEANFGIIEGAYEAQVILGHFWNKCGQGVVGLTIFYLSGVGWEKKVGIVFKVIEVRVEVV